GQAAELLGVEQPFLRSLDNAGVVSPERSNGGHRRYSRYQLSLAGRFRELFDEGHSLASAQRILKLETELNQAKKEISWWRQQFAEYSVHPPDGESDNGTGVISIHKSSRQHSG